jgi:hypothetical protein
MTMKGAIALRTEAARSAALLTAFSACTGSAVGGTLFIADETGARLGACLAFASTLANNGAVTVAARPQVRAEWGLGL